MWHLECQMTRLFQLRDSFQLASILEMISGKWPGCKACQAVPGLHRVSLSAALLSSSHSAVSSAAVSSEAVSSEAVSSAAVSSTSGRGAAVSSAAVSCQKCNSQLSAGGSLEQCRECRKATGDLSNCHSRWQHLVRKVKNWVSTVWRTSHICPG